MSEDFDRDAVRQLNDDFRQNFEGGQVLLTPGVLGLPNETLGKVLRAIRVFDEWTEDCDPWGLHDFGEVEIDSHKVWFKLDAYVRLVPEFFRQACA